MIETYHLNKVIEIQRKFINCEIDKAELDNQLKKENERYIGDLRAKSASIQENISMNSMHDRIRHELTKNINWRK